MFDFITGTTPLPVKSPVAPAGCVAVWDGGTRRQTSVRTDTGGRRKPFDARRPIEARE